MTQMSLADFGMPLENKAWEYDEDTGSMLCRCPECEGRLLIGLYSYWNPYRYCPYCGERLQEGKFAEPYCRIYGLSRETVRDVRRKYEKDWKHFQKGEP